MSKKLVTKLSLLILSFLLVVWGILSGCDKKKDNDNGVGPQPEYGPRSVSIKIINGVK